MTDRQTILLAEDDPTSLKVLGMVLRDVGGYEVLEAANESDAFRVCQQYSGPIHLIVTDVVLREGSGPGVLERLRTIRPELRALFISGSAREDLPQKNLIAPETFLQKPFLPTAFIEAVRRLLDAAAGTPN
jgi:CheY-like chemotaxis protein